MNNHSSKNWARITTFIFLLLGGFLAWQATKFEIDASADTLLVDDNRHYLLTQLADERYGSEEFILIAYQPKEKELFTEATLNRIDEISNKIKKLERVSNVRSIVNVPVFTAIDSLSTNIDANKLTWKEKKFSTEVLKKSLKNHPLYEDLLVNKKQNALSMQVVFKSNDKLVELQSSIINIKKNLLDRELDEKEQEKLEELQLEQSKINKSLDEQRIKEIEEIRGLLKPYEKSGEFYLGGNNLLAYQLIKIIQNDLVLFGSTIAIIVCFILLFLFRQFSWVFLPVFCCATSVIFTLGLLGALGFKVTVISANVFALQIILSLAMIIHLIVQYQEFVEEGKIDNQVDLVMKTIRTKIKPCFYAGLTTTIGFGSLIFSGVQPVISFGWMMVVAMMVTFAVSLIFFPALLISFFGVQSKVKTHKYIERSMQSCASLTKKRPSLIVITCIVATAVGIAGCFKLTAENSFLNYFDESTDVYRELSYIDKNFGGSTPFDLLYKIPKDAIKTDLVLTAETVQTVTAIQNMLAEQRAIGNITSIADFTRIAQVVNGKPLTEYELTALYHSLDKDLQQDLFSAYLSEKDNEVRISMRVQDTTPELNRADLLKTIHQKMEALNIPKENYKLTNLFILYQDILSRLVDSQVLTLGIVYLAMTIVLVIIFRSFKIAIISLVPNVITTAIIMGTMGIFNIPLDLMTITIAAVAMGISMDDTIHYVHRYLEEKSKQTKDIITASHLSVGYALIYTTTIIVTGFGALVFSDFVPSVLFGFLTSIAMIIALLTDITVLPVLLKKYLSKNET